MLFKTLPTSPAHRARALVDSVTGAVQRAVFTTAMNLPPGLQRRLAGSPVEIDGQELAVDTQLMLKLTRLAGPDPWTQPVDRARVALQHQCRLAGGTPPIGDLRTVQTPSGQGRLYLPRDAPRTGPLLVFFHGGGFALGDLDTHDAPCRVLAEEAGVRVLSVEYRLAPEDPFPAAYDDAVATFAWAVEMAESLGADPARIGVAGDSAGGNLAAGVALAQADACAFQLLLYPVTQLTETTRSRELFAEGFFLTAEAIEVCGGYYVPDRVDPRDPRVSPLHAEISAAPPAYIATAGFDPLRDEGEAYAARLREAGVEVIRRRFEDQIHGFLNVVGAGHSARAAVSEVAEVLRGRL